MEYGPGLHHGSSSASPDGLLHTADSEDLTGPKNGVKKCDNGGEKRRSKGEEEKGLKPCVGSKFAAANLRQSLDELIGFAIVKK